MIDSNTLILAALTRLEANQDSMRAEMATVRVSLMERTDRLEEGLSALREDMTATRIGLMERLDRLQNFALRHS